jgi:hypothetical protein
VPLLIQKYIAILLIFTFVTSSVSGYSTEAIHSLDELDISTTTISTLISERDLYTSEQQAEVSVFATESDLIGPSYVIERTSRVTGEVATRRVTSELLEATLVRNMTRDTVTTPQITITEAGPDAEIQAEQSFARDGLTPETLLTFEF